MSGETVFPLAEAGSAGRLPTESLSTAAALELGGAGFAAACGAGSSALKVRPAKGAALLFYTLEASGAHDPLSLHGGCPVPAAGTSPERLSASCACWLGACQVLLWL